MSYAAIQFLDGRTVAIMRKHHDGFEVMPYGGAVLTPGERVEVTGRKDGMPSVAVFVVGGKCGPGKRCYRLRIEGGRPA